MWLMQRLKYNLGLKKLTQKENDEAAIKILQLIKQLLDQTNT
jgi:hypothetical protein